MSLEDPSLYEQYTAGVTVGNEDDGINEAPVDAHLQNRLYAQFDGYAPVIFTKARDYWHTDLGGYGGMGLAEFTNREFVSKDTNFWMPDAEDYLSPSIDDSTVFTIGDAMGSVYGGSV